MTTLRGVGEKLRLRLSEIGIYSLEDLLFHFPLRYQDRTRVTPIGALTDQVDAVVQGDVRGAAVTMGRRRTLVVQIGDDTGLITVRFFHFRQTQVAQFKTGGRVTLFGTPRRSAGKVEMAHPEYRLGDEASLLEPALTPVYSRLDCIVLNAYIACVEFLLNPTTLAVTACTLTKPQHCLVFGP